MTKPPALTVVEFPHTPLHDVPAKLRQLADDIEANHYGPVGSCGVAILGDTFEVFGFGEDGNGPSICTLFQAGITRLTSDILTHGQ